VTIVSIAVMCVYVGVCFWIGFGFVDVCACVFWVRVSWGWRLECVENVEWAVIDQSWDCLEDVC